MEKEILIIVASVRPVRAGGKVARWVMNQAEGRPADYKYRLVDLREINLPFFDEPGSPRTAETYIHQHTRDWSAIIEPAAGFIFVTPEYNHGYAPALKNAVDFLYREWKGKPAGFVGYGGSGAKDSIRQMREILDRFRMRIAENQPGISKIGEAFDEDGRLNEDLVSGSITALFDELEGMIASTA